MKSYSDTQSCDHYWAVLEPIRVIEIHQFIFPPDPFELAPLWRACVKCGDIRS